jgi:hypothetical protein
MHPATLLSGLLAELKNGGSFEPPFRLSSKSQNYLAVTPFSFKATWAAARRAMGTRKGEQLT